MKNNVKRISFGLALLLVLQLLVLPVLPSALAAGADTETVRIVPQLSDGMTVAQEELDALTVQGQTDGDLFIFAENKTLSFTAVLGEGWSYSADYSNFFPSDTAHRTVTQNGDNTVTFTYQAIKGQSVDAVDLENVILNATASQLPTLKINIDGSFSSVTKDAWVAAEFELTLGTKQFSSGNYTGTGSVKGRGNTSWTYPQKPYSIKLDSKASLLDIPKTKKYAIISNYGDSSLMRNYITYKAGLRLQGIDYTPKCEFVAVYLNGTYNGIYLLVERIDIESTKIDIEEATDENITGGYIIEKDAGDKVDKSKDPWFSAPFQANPNEDLFTVKAPDPVTDEMLSYLETHMQKLHDALMGTSGEPYTQYIDVPSWVDFLIMQELSKNVDGNLKTSCYFIKERDNDIVQMTALWDFDNAYGTANWSNASQYNDYWDCPSGTGTSDFMVINSSCPWYQTLYAKPEFAALVQETYTQYRYSIIPDMQRMIDEQHAYLATAVANDRRWTSSYQFNSAVSTLKNWLDGRIQWLDQRWLLEPSIVITPEAASLRPGASQIFTATVSNLANDSVVWSVTGADSSSTRMEADGTLYVSADETSNSLTITAASAVCSISASVTVSVEGPSQAELLLAAAEAARKAAEEAQKKAEDAQAAAEAAQKAAEEAAASTAEDKAAAEKAAEEAQAAQEKAEAAKAAAEKAQKAAEAAAAAAEASNLAAAEEARKAAEDAAKSAASAADAAEYARQAAEAQKGAQEARQAAEEAQSAAEEAQKKAEEARKAAEDAAASAAEDKEAAEKAAAEAEAAQKAAEEAQKATEAAEEAAKVAEKAAADHDSAAAAAAAEAAKYAKEVAEKYEEICKIKAEMAQSLLDAQKATEQAEEAKKAAEAAELACAKYYALLTLTTYADKHDYAPDQQKELAAAVAAGRAAISAADTIADVDKALYAAKAAIDEIKTLEELKLSFTDVKEGSWYYDAVQFVVSEGLFKGVTDTLFAPNGKMDRAMVVTVLYRLAEEPEVEGECTFTDVEKGTYYYNALLWATQNEIVKGTTETTFSPKTAVSREQLVTFLYRYAQLRGADVNNEANLSQYRDANQVSAFAADSMAWAVGSGLVQGVDASTLAPKGTATRAQVAAILMRFAENLTE